MRSGIDIANYLRVRQTTPYVFLTSQFDAHHVYLVAATHPSGYLTEPIQRTTLLTTLAIALKKANAQTEVPAPTIVLREGTHNRVIRIADVAFVRAEHVYAIYQLVGGAELTQRESLTATSRRLAPGHFFQVHRAYLVNLDHVTAWTPTEVSLGGSTVPLSRSKRTDFAAAVARVRHLGSV